MCFRRYRSALHRISSAQLVHAVHHFEHIRPIPSDRDSHRPSPPHPNPFMAPVSSRAPMFFRVKKRVNYGERLVLVGSIPALGAWDPSAAVPCTWTPGDVWTADDVPRPPVHAPIRFEFKYCLLRENGEKVWEDGMNHAVHIPIHPASPPVITVDWGAGTSLHIPAHPTEPQINGDAFDDLVLNSPPPTPARSETANANMRDPLAIAVARVTAVNGHMPPIPAAGSQMVKFRIKYRLDEGEHIYVVGSIPELGGWNKMHSPCLSPVVGGLSGLYEAAMVLPRDKAHEQFEYKYFTRQPDGSRRWEDGDNRIARPFDASAPREREGDIVDPDAPVLWDDRWEKIRFEFSIYYPTKSSQVMHVTGDPPEIGAWYKPGPTKMELGPVQVLETDVKGRKWFLNVWTDPAQPPFQYRYIIIDKATKQELWEREPNRRAEFDEELPVINSVRILRDVNFVSEMQFDHVPPDMFIGPYPQTAADVDKLAEAGVTGVFNVQTDEDFKHRGIQWDVIKRQYNEHGIKVVRYPIRDFDRDSLRELLNGATHALHDLLRSGRKVYIHCTAGMGRAPACAVAYLCWVQKMELLEAVSFVKKHRKVAVPNVPVLEQALKDPY